jgi:phenylacetate-CoA ligase
MILTKLKKLYETQTQGRMAPEALSSFRNQRLQKVVAHAYESTAFYRERMDDAGLKPSDIRTAQDIVHLPIISRTEIQEHHSQVISNRFTEKDYVVRTTSGSSGKMLRVLYEKDNLWTRICMYYRCMSMIGYTPFQKLLYFLPTPEKTGFTLGLFRQMGLDPGTPFDEIRKHLLAFRPDIMAIYPSYAVSLGNYLSPDDIRRIGIKAISLNSEMILARDRAEIERVFNCPTYDEYSSVEIGYIASMCKERRMHGFTDSLVLEILDDQDNPCQPGEKGNVVLTSLINYAMPFLRYRMGDVASVLDSEPCPCGSPFPMLGPVEGRKDDSFILTDGTGIPAWKIYDIVERPLERYGMDKLVLSDFYLVQKAKDLAHFYYVKGPDFNGGYLNTLRRGIDGLFKNEITVNLHETDNIDRVKSVKRKYIHREISH